MTTQKSTWLITAKTNLHVGDECSTGYGLIDKSVQRDALMGLPCINSSSLKGALNEYCCHETTLKADQIHKIFGSDKKEKEKEKKIESQKGNTLFFDANILFLPVQDDDTLYKLAYCDEVIDRFIENAAVFEQNIDKKNFISNYKNIKEVTFDKFKTFCSDDELPIIARNVLENGESKNLWYEQIVPPETVFYTFLQSPDEILSTAINDKIVQIGANATIGYGYCKFNKISLL
jgi:CRISPR-associated protein Cmr4